jgi:DNA helicase-2/ATP-dependent DNA helicase PcrA
MEMLKMDKSVEAEGRIENLKELVNVMSDTNQYQTLAEFMEHVSLVMDNDNNVDTNKVMLITLHSAKGLEFDAVFLPGWEEGLFPHQRALDENSLEEERRLAYVAMTRAKKKLYILTALNRRIYGQWQNNLPSRFINELPPINIEISNHIANCFSGSSCNTSSGYKNNYWHNKKPQVKDIVKDGDRFSYEKDDFGWNNTCSQSKQNARNEAAIPTGTRVFHETFGFGKVLNVDGNKLEIWFEDYGHKKLLKDYVKKA